MVRGPACLNVGPSLHAGLFPLVLGPEPCELLLLRALIGILPIFRKAQVPRGIPRPEVSYQGIDKMGMAAA